MTKAHFDVFIHRLWIKVYHRWIRNNFPWKWHTNTSSDSNSRPGRFSTETPLERERRLQIQRDQRRRRRQQETAEQQEHRLAQRRQRRQQESEKQEIGIRGIMIVHRRKPIPADIYKFQLCIMARSIIIFRRTAPGQICSLFLSFSKSGRRNNAKAAFQYTVNNNSTL